MGERVAFKTWYFHFNGAVQGIFILWFYLFSIFTRKSSNKSVLGENLSIVFVDKSGTKRYRMATIVGVLSITMNSSFHTTELDMPCWHICVLSSNLLKRCENSFAKLMSRHSVHNYVFKPVIFFGILITFLNDPQNEYLNLPPGTKSDH